VHHICTTFAELFPPIAAGEPLFSRVRVAAPLGSAVLGRPRHGGRLVASGPRLRTQTEPDGRPPEGLRFRHQAWEVDATRVNLGGASGACRRRHAPASDDCFSRWSKPSNQTSSTLSQVVNDVGFTTGPLARCLSEPIQPAVVGRASTRLRCLGDRVRLIHYPHAPDPGA
jgi:hypothetical protein